MSQTLAWASTYYLPAILAEPMARDLGLSTLSVFAALSVALLIAAVLGPLAGRLIDRFGGRPVLSLTSVIAATGLGLLAISSGPVSLCLAWIVIGVAMSAGLYEAAFATVVRLHGRDARSAITGIALIAGFASTVGWPLSGWLEHVWGWRGACATWAVLHLLIGLPIHLRLPAAPAQGGSSGPVAEAAHAPQAPPPRAGLITVLLAISFAVTWFSSTAMAAHLPHLLQIVGLSAGTAIGAAALVGPSQVGARIFEFTLMRRLHPLLSARLASAAHPLGGVILLALGAPAVVLFASLHGAGNGILTIAKGTLPLVLFGPLGYGTRQGWLMVPARIAQALAPLVFGIALERYGTGALWLTIGLGLVGLIAVLLIPARSKA
mgnify:CR=1 FL=1